MNLSLAPIAILVQFASDQMSSWEKLEDKIVYLSVPARCVILCLMGMFLVSAGASIERFVRGLTAIKETKRFIRATQNAFSRRDDDALRRSAGENASSHIANLTETALSGYASARTPLGGRDAIELSMLEMARSKDILGRELKRRLSLLASIASTAPLVGLLGTVFAILD